MTMVQRDSILSFLLLLVVGQVHVRSQGVDLNGGIVTRTDVKEYADLSLDIRDIRAATTSDQILEIYTRGVHSQIQTGIDFSIKKVNDELVSSSLKTPQYLFHLYGLSGLSSDASELQQYSNYADVSIRDSIIAGGDQPVADAIIAYSMWMYANHLLYQGVHVCEVKTLADNADVVQGLAGGGMDEFIALWIGTDQTPGTSDGHGLYAWTQRIAAIFGTASPEASVNTALKLLYQGGAVAMSLSDHCSKNNPKTAPQLWNIAVQMSNQMMVPLYQWLLFSLLEKQSAQAAMYAKALVPQLSQCRPSLYKKLKEVLLDDEIDFGRIPEIIVDLQATYSCFDLTCDDIGEYEDKPQSACSDVHNRNPILAGFSTTSDVRGPSRIDHDIHQLKTLVSIGFDDFAQIIYKYGRNVPLYRDSENDPFQLVSLRDLATSTDRERAGDIFKNFLAYNPNDQFYADTAIWQALTKSGRWQNANNLQRAQVVALTSAFQVVFIELVSRLHDSFRECQDADSERGFEGEHNPLDEAAALLIGAMEGDTVDGSIDLEDGQLLWNLADQRSFEFDTTTRQGVARVNFEIQDLLYAAKGELNALDCTKLEREVFKIEALLTVAISQSVMKAASESADLPKTSTALSVVEGEVFALSILPLIYAVLPDAAANIEKNMVYSGSSAGTHHVPDGAQSVADSIGEFHVKGLKLSCNLLGGNRNVQPCKNHGGFVGSSGERQWISIALLISTVACVLIL